MKPFRTYHRAALLLLVAGLACPVSASVLENAGWALLSSVELAAGYDSNLDFTRDSLGSAYASLSPSLSLRRKNSGASLDTTVTLDGTRFARKEVGSQLDWRLQSNLAYPYTDDGFPRTTASLSWQRFTAANQWLGERVHFDQGAAQVQSKVISSERTGLVVGLSGSQTTPPDKQLNKSQTGRASVALSYDLSPKTELSLTYLAGLGNSITQAPGALSVKSRQQTLGLQARGELFGKLSGTAMAGISRISYRDAYQRTDTQPYAKINLTWELDPRRSLIWLAELDADFSPEGESVLTRESSLRYKQQMSGPWSWSVIAGTAVLDYWRQTFIRRDTVAHGGAQLECSVSEGFSFVLSVQARKQWSTFERFDFTRTLTETSVTYKF